MPVLRLAYAAAGLGWLLRPTGFGPLRPAFDAAYRVFARNRKAISRALAPAIAAAAHPARDAGGPHERPGLRRQRMHRPGGRPGAALARPPRRRGEPQAPSTAATRWRSTSCASARRPIGRPSCGARRIDAVVNCVGILMPGAERQLRAGAHRGADRAVPRRRARRRRPHRPGLGARRRRLGRGRAKRTTCAASASPTRRCSAWTASTPRSFARRWCSGRAARAPRCSPPSASLPVIGLPGTGRQRRAADPRARAGRDRRRPGRAHRLCARRLRARRQGAARLSAACSRTYRRALGLGDASLAAGADAVDGARRATRRAGAAARLQPRHAAPSRRRQRAVAQRRAGAARPRRRAAWTKAWR